MHTIYLIIASTLLMLAAVIPTQILHRQVGALVVSQSTVAGIAGLTYALLRLDEQSTFVSVFTSLITAELVSLIHVPLLYFGGTRVLLIGTAFSTILLVQVWYGIPTLTGGSGGLLIQETLSPLPHLALLLTTIMLALSIIKYLEKSNQYQFNLACIRHLGPRSVLFGAKPLRDYTLAFVLYGLLLGIAGIASVELFQFITPLSFNFAWAFACVMIALSTKSLKWTILLAMSFSILSNVLRFELGASPAAGHVSEMIFPTALLLRIIWQNNINLKSRPDGS